jgi:hypothetical protein
VKEDILIKIEKNILKWIHVEMKWMDERLTKEIYEAVFRDNAVRGKHRRTFSGQIGQVLEKGQSYEEFDESRGSERWV